MAVSWHGTQMVAPIYLAPHSVFTGKSTCHNIPNLCNKDSEFMTEKAF